MGPPTYSPSSSTRQRTARTASAYLVAMPKNPPIHIQNTAPGPPRAMAPATPTRFPVPTVAARAVHSAWKSPAPFSPREEKNRRSAFPKQVTWTNPVRQEISTPAPRIKITSQGPQMRLRTSSQNEAIIPPKNIILLPNLQLTILTFPTEQRKKAVPDHGNCFCKRLLIPRSPIPRGNSRRWPACRCAPQGSSSGWDRQRPCLPWRSCHPCTSSG